MKVLLQWLRRRIPHLGLASAAAVLFICALFAWRLVAATPDGRLHVTFLDVGSADAILVETPSGGKVLINGGPSATAVSEALGRRMSPVDRRLEWLVVAASDEQQVASLPSLVQRFPPAHVLFGAPEGASFSSSALMSGLLEAEIPVERAEPGQSLDLGSGARLKVLDVSSRGSTLLLEWNTFRLLLPVGANLDTLESLDYGRGPGPVGALLVSQSGYAPLTPQDWLDNLHPRLAVISVAAADRDGLPDPETLDVLDGYPVLRTDRNGWIEITTDGSRMWVASQRQGAQTGP